MTTEQLIRHLGTCRRRLKVLRDDNQRIWESREEWKRRHRETARQNTTLRRDVMRLRESRDMWRARAPRPSVRTNRPAVQLRPGDLDVILRMRCRD